MRKLAALTLIALLGGCAYMLRYEKLNDHLFYRIDSESLSADSGYGVNHVAYYYVTDNSNLGRPWTNFFVHLTVVNGRLTDFNLRNLNYLKPGYLEGVIFTDNGDGVALRLFFENVAEQINNHRSAKGNIKYKYKNTPKIGIGVTLKSAYGFVFVDSILPNSPAEKADLNAGDVVQEVNGRHVTSAQDIVNIITILPPNSVVKLLIKREGKVIKVSLRTAILN